MAAVASPPPSLLSEPPKECIHGDDEEGEEYPETVSGESPIATTSIKDLYASYLGVSFAVFLSLLPESSISLIPTLQCRNNYLSVRLHQAEEQLHQLKSRRQEDSKANARVVEIFASHRNAWQREERRLIQQIDESGEENARLRERVMELERNESGLLGEIDDLKREIEERDELLNFMSRKAVSGDVFEEVGSVVGGGGGGEDVFEDLDFQGLGGRRYTAAAPARDERLMDFGKGVGLVFGSGKDGFDPNFLSSVASKLWAEKASSWQDVRYESSESLYHMKHFVPRRESPWKVDSDSTGVSSKIKVLEQELSNLEGIGNGEVSKVPSLMRKQAKRYKDLAGKIDDLCKRMQASDPCDPNLSSEFQTQRQTEFLLEAIRLQQRAMEAGQKLTTLEAEVSSSYATTEAGSHVMLPVRRSIDSIKSNFREIQRNLEIWLARIVGDLEGILARNGASRVREYCVSRCRYV